MLDSTEMSWYIHACRKKTAWLCHKVGTPKDPLESKKHLNHDTKKIGSKGRWWRCFEYNHSIPACTYLFLVVVLNERILTWTNIHIKSLDFNHLNWWFWPLTHFQDHHFGGITEINMTNCRKKNSGFTPMSISDIWRVKLRDVRNMIHLCYVLSWKSYSCT